MTKEFVGELKFRSPINSETSYGQTRLADDVESVLDIHISDDGIGYVEWEIEALNTGETIGLWFDDDELIDYDGVFELPSELVVYLREQGYNMDYVD